MKLQISARSLIVDQLRGVAVVFMVLFHFTYDLKTFANPPSEFVLGFPKWFWFWVPATIGSTFLFLSGLSLRLAGAKDQNTVRQKDLSRLAKLICFALLITILTLIYIPTAPIYFGILHCIAFGSLLILILRKVSPRLILSLAILLIAGGILLEFTEPLSFSWLNWLGFRTKPSPMVSDYYPVMPFTGIMLLGYGLPEKLRQPIHGSRKIPLPFLDYLGRHSLVIYLIHQPILIGLVYLIF